MNTSFWIWALILLSLVASFLFSGFEAGVSALSPLRIRHRARAGDASARLLNRFLEDPENFLWTILVGNALANFTAVSLLAYALNELLPRPWLFVPVLLLAFFLLYALGDLLPKMLFRQFPNRLSLLVATPFRLVHIGLSPLVALMARLTTLCLHGTGGKAFSGHLFANREEFRMVMQESAHTLTSEEQRMINRVLDLQSLTVGHITVPMDKLITVTARTKVTEVLRLCREGGLTRLPVRESERGRVLGFVRLRTLLYRAEIDTSATAGEFLQPALYLDESTPLETALSRLKKSGQRDAFVLGRMRQEVGIIALEDILRFIFGELSL